MLAGISCRPASPAAAARAKDTADTAASLASVTGFGGNGTPWRRKKCRNWRLLSCCKLPHCSVAAQGQAGMIQPQITPSCGCGSPPSPAAGGEAAGRCSAVSAVCSAVQSTAHGALIFDRGIGWQRWAQSWHIPGAAPDQRGAVRAPVSTQQHPRLRARPHRPAGGGLGALLHSCRWKGTFEGPREYLVTLNKAHANKAHTKGWHHQGGGLGSRARGASRTPVTDIQQCLRFLTQPPSIIYGQSVSAELGYTREIQSRGWNKIKKQEIKAFKW